MIVRPRVDEDLDSCEWLANEVWQRDGYPVYGSDDLRGFITTADAIEAWVAEDDDTVIGHVVIRPLGHSAVTTVACEATGQPSDRLCAVSRLLVAPSARRRRVGTLLLDTATAGARVLGLWPILDVVAGTGAVAFYQASGWRPAGVVEVSLPDGTAIDELVFIGPPAR